MSRRTEQKHQERLERGVRAFKELVVATRELNQARDDYRAGVEQLAGCELEGWSLKELVEYVELGRMAVGLGGGDCNDEDWAENN